MKIWYASTWEESVADEQGKFNCPEPPTHKQKPWRMTGVVVFPVTVIKDGKPTNHNVWRVVWYWERKEPETWWERLCAWFRWTFTQS